MLPVHVKKNAPTFGPGGGAHKDAVLTSDVEAPRGASKLRQLDRARRGRAAAVPRTRTYAPAGVSLDQLPGPTEGLVANVSLEMKNGELAVAGVFVGDTYRELYDFGDGNDVSVTTFRRRLRRPATATRATASGTSARTPSATRSRRRSWRRC